jgi:hypothetical protein
MNRSLAKFQIRILPMHNRLIANALPPDPIRCIQAWTFRPQSPDNEDIVHAQHSTKRMRERAKWAAHSLYCVCIACAYCQIGSQRQGNALTINELHIWIHTCLT